MYSSIPCKNVMSNVKDRGVRKPAEVLVYKVYRSWLSTSEYIQ